MTGGSRPKANETPEVPSNDADDKTQWPWFIVKVGVSQRVFVRSIYTGRSCGTTVHELRTMIPGMMSGMAHRDNVNSRLGEIDRSIKGALEYLSSLERAFRIVSHSPPT